MGCGEEDVPTINEGDKASTHLIIPTSIFIHVLPFVTEDDQRR